MNKENAIKICEQMTEDINNLCYCPLSNASCIGCRELAIKTLLDYINQLETNRDELKKWWEEEKNKHYDRKWLSDDELCYRLEDNSAKTIIAVQTKIEELERGKE